MSGKKTSYFLPPLNGYDFSTAERREMFLPEVSRWMTVLSVLFFAPPGVLLYRAKKERDNHTRLLIRNLYS